MRIERLALEKYSLFTDRVLDFRTDATVHVVLGANEAGKTSALSAIGDWLFGFGHLAAYDFKHDATALRLGGVLRHSDGRLISARRRRGRKNTLLDDNDQPLSDDHLAATLGGVTREIFSREFGLTAQALRDGGLELLKAGGSLAETLAAGSAGLTALSRRRDELGFEADELFTPRKTASRAFYVASERFDAAERALRDQTITADALQASADAMQAARDHLASLNAAHAGAGIDLARLQRALRSRGKLARLDTIAQALTALSDLPDVPPSTLATWQRAGDDDARLADELQRLDLADAADRQAMTGLAVDTRLLAAGGAIDALNRRIGAVEKAQTDLPRRRAARQEAQNTLDAAARRLGLAGHGELLARQPSDPALERARELIEAHRRLTETLEQAEARRVRALRERDAVQAEDGNAAVVDPEPARQRLAALLEIPAQADRLRRETATLEAERAALAADVAALNPPAGPLDALPTLALPDATTIATHVRSAEAIESEIRKLHEALATAKAAITDADAELARLADDGIAVTRADLAAARAQREERFDDLQQQIDSTDRTTRLTAARAASQSVDRISDQLLADTTRAARREATLERRAQTERNHNRDAAALAGLQVRTGEMDAGWRSIWVVSGLSPQAPAEMARWREHVESLRARIGKLAVQRSGIAALTAQLADSHAALVTLLTHLGRTPDQDTAADILHREAQGRLDELQKIWTEARARSVARDRADRDLAEADAAIADAHKKRDALKADWPAALRNIGMSETASPAEAAAALAVWQTVAVPRTNFDSFGHQIDTMEADLAGFARDVHAITAQFTPDHADADPQAALTHLTARMNDLRRADIEAMRLKEALARRATARGTLSAQRAPLAAVLSDAGTALNATDLAAPFARLTERHALDAERASLLRDIADIADGRDEAALRAEQGGIDGDALPGEIALAEARQKQLFAEFNEASGQLRDLTRAYDDLSRGRDAAAAATERAEAAGDLVSTAERWLLRAAAARLATRAIEKHRAMVQDPLLARAGALFALATNGGFSGLAVGYDDKDIPQLKAVRADDAVDVAGLSEGTRDQLFLALRLALLERRSSEPMPFIGDDLLASFDDARSAATLRLLADAGRHRQIILFTHHNHVAELAAAQGAGVEVIRL